VANRRLGLVASQLGGLMMARYILKLPALVELSVEELTAAVAPTPGPARLVGDTNRTQDHEIGVLPERRNDLAGMHPDNPLTHRGLDPFWHLHILLESERWHETWGASEFTSRCWYAPWSDGQLSPERLARP
jgi:hypothetical protein